VVAGLRAQAEQTPNLNSFRGFVIRRSPLTLVDVERLQRFTSAPLWRGQMRAPDRIFGTPADASCLNGVRVGEQAVPEKILYVVPRARVIGNNCIIDQSGGVFSPSAALTDADLKRVVTQNGNNHHGFAAVSVNGGTSAYYGSSPTPAQINGRGLFLHNLEPSNYGSFLFRQLPQIVLLRNSSLEFDFYIVPDRMPWLREALLLVGLPNRPIYTVREVAGETFTSIAFFNEFDAEGFFSEDMAEQFLSLARTVWPAALGPTGRRIYVSRRLGTLHRPDYRPLSNEKAIETIFERRGFLVVHPETLSFPDQIGLFRQAEIVAGPSGSGMLNAMFCSPDTRVLDMESFHYTVRQHAKIYSSTHKNYAFLFGDVDRSSGRALHQAAWSARAELVEEAIEWLLMKP
jgi:capsular polysaccharide biosynthesis protein